MTNSIASFENDDHLRHEEVERLGISMANVLIGGDELEMKRLQRWSSESDLPKMILVNDGSSSCIHGGDSDDKHYHDDDCSVITMETSDFYHFQSPPPPGAAYTRGGGGSNVGCDGESVSSSSSNSSSWYSLMSFKLDIGESPAVVQTSSSPTGSITKDKTPTLPRRQLSRCSTISAASKSIESSSEEESYSSSSYDVNKAKFQQQQPALSPSNEINQESGHTASTASMSSTGEEFVVSPLTTSAKTPQDKMVTMLPPRQRRRARANDGYTFNPKMKSTSNNDVESSSPSKEEVMMTVSSGGGSSSPSSSSCHPPRRQKNKSTGNSSGKCTPSSSVARTKSTTTSKTTLRNHHHHPKARRKCKSVDSTLHNYVMWTVKEEE